MYELAKNFLKKSDKLRHLLKNLKIIINQLNLKK